MGKTTGKYWHFVTICLERVGRGFGEPSEELWREYVFLTLVHNLRGVSKWICADAVMFGVMRRNNMCFAYMRLLY